MTVVARRPLVTEAPLSDVPSGIVGTLFSTDHKRIGLLTVGSALAFFFLFGAFALVMRAQLALPHQQLVSPNLYDELFTMHGSGMIFLVITPVAVGFGVYVIPLQIGAPAIAAPRVASFGYWMYVAGALTMLSGFLTSGGAAQDGWYSYLPLADSTYTPTPGQSLWLVGVFLAALGMIMVSACMLWTVLRMRAPGVTPLRMPIFCWSEIVTYLMVIGSFPALLAAMTLMAIGRVDPNLFTHNVWNIGYQNLFWFFGHPVVYVMFFPFVGAVIETLNTFSGRRYNSYKFTVASLLVFAALSMSVWGHHLFVSGQVSDDYYSFTTLSLAVPASIEYFGFLSTIIGGRLRFTTPMLFALAFIPQFFIGGATGIMLGTPVVDYNFNGSYFVVAHFHYTLFAGSVFGMFAGFYYWWPKATGYMLSERLGKLHFWLMVVGTNTTFGPMFAVGFLGMPRRVATYAGHPWWLVLNLTESCGAGVIALAMGVLVINVVRSTRKRVPAPADPWDGQTLEWVTTSPPPRYNFTAIPPVKTFAPLADLKEIAMMEGDG